MPTTSPPCLMPGADALDARGVSKSDPSREDSALSGACAAIVKPVSPDAAVPVDRLATADNEGAKSDTPSAPPVRARARGTLPVVGLFLIALVAALYLSRAILMPILYGMIMAVVLAPVVEWLSRRRIPEPVGAALVMLALLGILFVVIEVLVLPAWDVLAELPLQVQTLWGNVLDWIRSFRLGKWLAPRDGIEVNKQAAAQGLTLTGVLFKSAQSFVISAISSSVLAYFLLSSGDLFLTKLVRVLPTIRDKVRAVTVVRTVQRDVATYFSSVSIINVCLGIGVMLLTWAFGLPIPWFWGSMVALLNFIPYVGAAVSALLLLLAGMAFTDSTGQAFLLVACFAGITFVEGQLINPLLVGKRLALNHTIVFVALLFWGWMWGVGGMLLAVPMLIIIKKVADNTPGWEAVAEFLAR